LRAFGVDLRKAVLVSLVAVAPDLDVLFNVHRSQTHSVIVLAVVALPLFVLTRNRKEARTFVLLGAFGVLTYLVLDLFQAPTPFLWPLLSQSLLVSVGLDLHIGSMPLITGSAALIFGKSTIEYFSSFNEPLLTAEGFGVSLVLLAPTILTLLRDVKSLKWQDR
jgi:membrane-bound metal-dependent hydrolase YbcI (DUF457 family)